MRDELSMLEDGKLFWRMACCGPAGMRMYFRNSAISGLDWSNVTWAPKYIATHGIHTVTISCMVWLAILDCVHQMQPSRQISWFIITQQVLETQIARIPMRMDHVPVLHA
jgi:hypothetical protein